MPTITERSPIDQETPSTAKYTAEATSLQRALDLHEDWRINPNLLKQPDFDTILEQEKRLATDIGKLFSGREVVAWRAFNQTTVVSTLDIPAATSGHAGYEYRRGSLVIECLLAPVGGEAEAPVALIEINEYNRPLPEYSITQLGAEASTKPTEVVTLGTDYYIG